MTYNQIVFLVILFGVVYTLFKYSQEGDINTFIGSSPSVREIRERYTSRGQIAERLHHLLIYQNGYVRWNRILIISMFVSMIIIYLYEKEIKLEKFILLTAFIFLAVDLPNRWGHSHVRQGTIQEGTSLISHYYSLPN